MTTEVAAVAALVVYLLGLAVTFGVRSWAHHRRTGSSGFNGFSGAPGSAGWWGGVLFAGALVLGAAGPTLALTGVLVPSASLPDGLAVVGLAVAVLGFVGVVAAQSGMGSSWRVGVDAAERTALVMSGPFALVRNPIFTAMCTALVGLVLMVPSGVTFAALVCLLAAVQLQVRVVEEPYLRTTHGPDYASYAARVGRFVPGVGRLDHDEPARST